MPNQIEREVWVKQDKLKNPIHYVRGTDLLPIVFNFRDFTIPSGATARVFVAKPDGNAVYDSATIEGNDVTVDVTEQMFLVLGMTLMQISIFDGEEELVSFAQPVMVEQNLKAGDLPESTTDVSFLDDAIEQANQAVSTATTAASQAAQAVQNANQAIADANEAISDLNQQIASMNTNFATLANNVSISQLQTTAKTLVGAVNELNGNMFFEPGETFSLAYTVASAFLTSGGETLYICIPCGKLLYNVSGFSISGEGIYVRQNGNYLIGSSSASGNFDGMQVLLRRVLKDLGTLLIVVSNDTGFPNSINNDVVSAYFDKGTITFE